MIHRLHAKQWARMPAPFNPKLWAYLVFDNRLDSVGRSDSPSRHKSLPALSQLHHNLR
jgi:hypothetical protein